MDCVKLCHDGFSFMATAVKTVCADFAFRQSDGFDKSLESAEAERVEAEIFADFLHHAAIGF
jgi:hypothetical protein